MIKKKLLYVISNPSQFKSFFREKINILHIDCDVSFLIYPYGFSFNKDLEKEIKNWTKKLKKKAIIKKVWFLEPYSYTDIKKNINSNLKFLKIIKEIDKQGIDILLVPSLKHHWEKIIVNYYNNKKIVGYLLSPPSGLDLFNSLKDFNNSIIKKKLIFGMGKFTVKSDTKYLHEINTDFKMLKKEFYIIRYIFEKIKIRINLLINFFFLPIYLKSYDNKTNNFYDKINFNFFKIDKIICFHPLLFKLLKKTFPNKKIYLNKLKIEKNSKTLKVKKKWIFLCNDNYFKSLNAFYQVLLNLKKINKIDKIYIKRHPTWQSKKLDKNFFIKLNEIKVKYKILNKTKNIIYEKYFGIISEPSTAYIESLLHNKNIKIIGISKNIQTTSGAIFELYKKIKEICWDPDIKILKRHLSNKILHKRFSDITRKYIDL